MIVGNQYLEKIAKSPFSGALAGESVHDSLKKKYNPKSDTFQGVTHSDLTAYAKIIAMKTQHNISNGFTDKVKV